MSVKVAAFRAQLAAKMAELTIAISGSLGAVVLEQHADQMDMIVAETGRNLSAEQIEKCQKMLTLVVRAISKIDQTEGTFGLCESCEEEIRAKRLEALPWARYCVVCQKRQDGEVELLSSDSGTTHYYAGPRLPQTSTAPKGNLFQHLEQAQRGRRHRSL